MNLPKGKGKRKIVEVLDPTSLQSVPSRYQQLMKRINNCKATSIWGCNSCTVPTLGRCMGKVRQHLQTEAFKQYHETKNYKKEQERLNFPAV